MLLSTITETFLLERSAARYSPNTLRDYRVTFTKLVNFLGDVEFREITRSRIVEFFDQQPVSAKTLRNYHTDLSALWQWAKQEGLCEENLIRSIRPPIVEKKEVVPFNRVEILALLDQVTKTNNPIVALRNKAILYVLLDTGVRASELCGLRIQDINQVTMHIMVFGKGKKERHIPISQMTLAAIQDYLKQRGGKSEWVFVTMNNHRPINRIRLGSILEKIGKQAGIGHVYPHRFRHTFAIQFLRNGGNIYSLQRILGHTTLDMVKRYLAISQIDLDRDHAVASPVTCWLGH
ncbi:MAG: tyrosine-type recombinase/integrase [Anaerolineales bacterium]|jgi:site-specific recombinase XerD